MTCLRSIRTNLGYLSSCGLADFEKTVITNHTKLIKDGSLQVSEGVDLTIKDLTHIKGKKGEIIMGKVGNGKSITDGNRGR